MRGSRGAALLEVLAAVAILGIAGLAFLELLGAGTRAEAGARMRERELADAERLVAAWSLLTARELDQRLGRRNVGPYIVGVQRPERGLYRIAIERGHIEELVTVVYRRDTRDVR